MIGCPEEISIRNGWMTQKEVEVQADKYSKSDYGKYLYKILQVGV